MNRTFIIITFVLVAIIYHAGPWKAKDLVAGNQKREMVEVTSATWDQEVIGNRNPVLVFFYTADSAACQQYFPVLKDANDLLDGQVKFARVEWDKNTSIALRYQITSPPTFVLVKNGIIHDKLNPESVLDLNGLHDQLLAYSQTP